jgi:phospholipid/cholesterol/gamma-HCH transport system permease protein
VIAHASELEKDLNQRLAGGRRAKLPSFTLPFLEEPGGGAGKRSIVFDLAAVETLDTAGAWLLHCTLRALQDAGAQVELEGLKPPQAALLHQVEANYRPCQIQPPQQNLVVQIVAGVGQTTLQLIDSAASFVSFLGKVILVSVHSVLHPRRLRLTSTVFHMEQVGLNAMPIVGLISFLIGIVLAYQGAMQLKLFGAELFVVDLIAISILRELGILLTAVVIAGRSASAFAAQIGSMKVHEEVDAMRVLGLDPVELLILPRLLALTLTLPLLAFFADCMGLLGGGLMCWTVLGISPELYLERLKDATGHWDLWVGIIKAPVFALLIALVGSNEGMQVAGSAESVGEHTTNAVVKAIFLVIVFDALFSILFSILGI